MKKHVLITGSSRGLGSALLKIYAVQGAEIIALDRYRNEKLQNEHPGVIFRSIDISEEQSVKELINSLVATDKLPDTIIFNAAIHTIDNDPFIEFETFNNVININMMSIFHFLSCLMPVLGKRATFVFISSGVIIFPNPACLGYYISKLAVSKAFDHFADRYARRNFRFKNVILGPLYSPMLNDSRPPAEIIKFLRNITTGTIETAAIKIVKFAENRKKRMYYLRLSALVLWITRIAQNMLPKTMKFYQISIQEKREGGNS